MTKPTDDPTIGRLVADVTRDLSSIVQHEIALVKSELRVSVKAGGIGAALVAAAAFLLLLVLILGSVTIAYFLTMTGLHAAWAFLIVTVFYLLVAVVLLLVAWSRFKKIRVPEKSIGTARQLPSALKPGNHAAGNRVKTAARG
ncbi:phage holin family protein [Aeromicrobium sp. 636]|uniref:Phage holin family protein n=1 Tax=Aeromicrobium senzhongii TaxID=2663859 RepID=A0A8I0EWT2_9ACTN|nr:MULTISPECIES: phage holin family protein [Aeromicrobium]MBC9227043.1 phage holin family protein [Aeromicrobium senzhongii]MCQ3999143.1 phage holin family protein [Aeromicrobium sp. 636]MTB89356.1 phage holin family protein [Aeromicrobium senzhongii]QNL94492.1 phage holin family protein [Aeromicrobium senzhongii]